MHNQLNSKEDFEKAVQTKGKYVFVMVYENEEPANADEHAKRMSDKVESYKFDISKAPQAKAAHKIEKLPCALIYKDGNLVKKVDGMEPAEMQEVGKMLNA